MKSIHQKIALGVLLIASTGYAQIDKGNGGRVWVCYGQKNSVTGKRPIQKVELVDYVEARSITTWDINLGVDQPGVDDTDAMIETALTRLAKVDRWRADQVRVKIEEMKQPQLARVLDLEKDQVALSKITDANILITPTEGQDCLEQQGAFNKSNPGPMQYKYAFIKQYMEKMSDQDRAGLLLHEAIYNLEASKGAENSDGTREQVRAISSPSFAQFDSEHYYYDFIQRYSKLPSVSDANAASYFDIGSYEGKRGLQGSTIYEGNLLINHHYSTVSLCPESRGWVANCKVEQRKLYEMPVTASAGERLEFFPGIDGTTNEKTVALSRGGFVETGVFKARLFDINYLTDGFSIGNAAIKSISLDGHMPVARISTNWALNPFPFTFQVGTKKMALKYPGGQQVKFDLELCWDEHLGYRGYLAEHVQIDTEGNIRALDLTIEDTFSNDLNVSVTDSKGKTVKVKLNHPRFKVINYELKFREYLHLEFSSEGEITNWSVFRKNL